MSTDDKEWTSGGIKDPFLISEEPSGRAPVRAVSEENTSSQGLKHAKYSEDRQSTIQQANDLLARTISGPDPRPVHDCDNRRISSKWMG